MSSALPYRPPCGGWTKKHIRGGCFQHWRYSEAHVQKYENITTVANYVCPQSPARITPYERPDGIQGAADGLCSGGGDTLPEDANWCDSAHTLPPCGEWERREFQALGPDVQIDVNGYNILDDEVKNLTRCQKVGFKGAQARKCWHGRYGFNVQPEDGCDGESVPTTPPQTKYLTVRRWGWWQEDAIGGGQTDYAEFDGTFTVDTTSGVVTLSSCSYESWRDTGGGPVAQNPGVFPSLINWLSVGYSNGMCQSDIDDWEANGADWADTGQPGDYFSDTITETTIHAEGQSTDIPANKIYTFEIDAELSNTYTAGQCYNDAVELLDEWDLTDDKVYPWREDRLTTVNPLVTRDEYPSAVNPDKIDEIEMPTPCGWEDPGTYDPVSGLGYSGAILGKPFTDGYAESRVDSDQEDILYQAYDASTLDLTQPGILEATVTAERWEWTGSEYEWAYTGILDTDFTVAYDEDSGASTITLVNQGGSNPLSCNVGSCADEGSHGDQLRVSYSYYWIFGGHFDWRHVNTTWEYVNPTWYNTNWYGAWSGGSGALDPADAAMPHSATQWTDSDDAATFPHGAWAIMVGGSGALWLQKYSEIKLPWKSQNWFGPCGKDRDLMEDGSTCEDIGSGCEYTDDTNVWPDAWPIEGDRIFTAEESGGTVTVTLAAPAEYLRASDTVEFTNDKGEVIGSAETVVSVAGDGSWFTYSGALHPPATRVKSEGAPSYWWYDNDGKGNYSAVEHTFDYRTYYIDNAGAEDPGTAAVTNGCLKFDQCRPAVMCWSPNGEAFEHGTTYPFGSIVMDGRFGARWQAFFKQIMTDFWWSAPDAPCEDDGLGGCAPRAGWTEDTGDCLADVEDTTYYYPHRPWVECLEERPDAWDPYGQGANELVPTDSIPAVSYEALPAVGPASHITTPDATDNEYAPWNVWQAMQQCICDEGRFAGDTTYGRGYENMLGAWMCGEEPAGVGT